MNEEVKACAECGSPNTSASQFCSPPCFEKAVARQSRTPASCSPDAEDIARLFHETYERLAPQFSYETRKESAVPWEQVPENNRKLMIAVAGVVGESMMRREDAPTIR